MHFRVGTLYVSQWQRSRRAYYLGDVQNSIDSLSNHNPQIRTPNPPLLLDIFPSRSSYIWLEFLQGSTDVYGRQQSRGRKYSLTLTSYFFFKALSFYSKRLSELWTILDLALFSVSRPPSFLDQGTIICHLTPGSEWLNGWFLAVSAVTGSVRHFVHTCIIHIYMYIYT